MEKMTIKRSSIWYTIAVRGGFKDYAYSKLSSCQYYSSIFLGLITHALVYTIGIGMIIDAIVYLISLGMPSFFNTAAESVIVSVFMAMGFLGWFLMAVLCFVIFVVIFAKYFGERMAEIVFSTVRFFTKNKTIEQLHDYAKGICRPVEIID